MLAMLTDENCRLTLSSQLRGKYVVFAQIYFHYVAHVYGHKIW